MVKIINECNVTPHKFGFRNCTPGIVYIVNVGAAVYKIGFTSAKDLYTGIETRLYALEKKVQRYEIEVKYLLHSDCARGLESHLHAKFNNYRLPQLDKEFFWLNDESMWYINGITEFNNNPVTLVKTTQYNKFLRNIRGKVLVM